MIISSNVPQQFKNWPIVDYLATRFSYLSREEWRDWVLAGKVWKDGRVCTLDTVVTQGNLIACELPDWEQPDANFDYKIIYEDGWLLGINKPPNLRAHSGGKFLKANLMYRLKYVHEPPYPEAELVNRLDADTSGVMLVGKNKAIIPLMGELFARQRVQKGYLALVVGVPAEKEGVLALPIGKVPDTKVRFGVENVQNPRDAVTHYEVVQAFGAQYALLNLWPETGRTHQIRVHLAAVGHPIVGDKLYRSASEEQFVYWSNNPDAAADADLIRRQALHCAWTQFEHPCTGEETRITAPLAGDLRRLLDALKAKF